MTDTNLIGLDGLEFIEFSSNDPLSLEKLFKEFILAFLIKSESLLKMSKSETIEQKARVIFSW